MSTFEEIMENTTQNKLGNYKIPLKTEPDPKLDEKVESEKTDIEPEAEIIEVFQTPLTYVEADTSRKLDPMRFDYTYQHSVTITPTVKNCANKRSYGFPPPPPPPPLPEEEFYKRWPYLNSSTFPDSLKQMLQPLKCELCRIRINSRISGKMHYESHGHAKKVDLWLQEWAKKTGEPAPKQVKLAKETLPVGPNAYHCEACDIALTSVQHAEQHYTGKKHRAVVLGLSTPSGSGQPAPLAPAVNFYNSTTVDNKSMSKLTPATAASLSTDPSVFCSICNIHVSRESQMSAHLEGAKHAKKLRSLQAPPYVVALDTLLTSVASKVTPSKEPPLSSQQKIDISIYRTPSGSFYCQLCDITLETEHLFNQHLNCKKHIRKQNTNGKE